MAKNLNIFSTNFQCYKSVIKYFKTILKMLNTIILGITNKYYVKCYRIRTIISKKISDF